MLQDDMVSHGVVAQCVDQSKTACNTIRSEVETALTELLSSGGVEIGEARLSSADYVEFIAWNGSVDARVKRALAAIDSAHDPGKEFAYWLCLRRNVDRFEG